MGYIGAGISRFNTADELTVTGDAEFKGSVNLGDNDKAVFGVGNDLQIYHNATHSYIDNNTGNIYIRSNVDDDDGGNIVLEAKAGESGIIIADDGDVSLHFNGSPKLATTNTGISVTGNATFADNGKAVFGAGSDLEIYHDGSDSWISDAAGLGNLYIRSNDLIIMNAPNNETLLRASQDGAVTAYYNGSPKLATTASGIDVTGNIDFSSGILASNGSVQFVMDKDNNGGEVFVWGHNASNATTNELMRLNSSGQLSIGSTASSEKLRVSGNIEVYNDDVDGYVWFHDPNTRSWSVGSDRSTGRFVISSVQGIASNLEFQIDGSGNVITTGSITANGGFVGAGSTPAFCVTRNSTQTSNSGIATLVQWNAEIYDSDGKFASNRFTPTEAGYYYLFAQVNNVDLHSQGALNVWIRKNNVNIMQGNIAGNNSTSNRDYTINCSIINVADSDDYFEVYAEQQMGNGEPIATADRCVFLGYKVG